MGFLPILLSQRSRHIQMGELPEGETDRLLSSHWAVPRQKDHEPEQAYG